MSRFRSNYLAIAVLACGCWLATLAHAVEPAEEAALSQLPEQPDFSRDIQPILSRACTSCHGGVKQAGDLSFVYASSVLPPDGWVIEPGQPDESILMDRITATDPEERMPPPGEHTPSLSKREIELFRRWIAGGAPWQDLWSRLPLYDRPPPQQRESAEWAKRPLDNFVHQQLQRQGLQPNRQAEPMQWLRRASFDLIGLPPTPEELQAFQHALDHSSADAASEMVYEQEVERLLASAHYGERWGAMWMDVARYADSQGFEKDPHRDMWPYRDWLINAFNNDMPYDDFTVKQLAGDLLPNPSYDDLVATAFHRNTQTNTEGGTDDEEFRIAAVIDRLNTTWTTWQATTFGCVQCHAHPYEPIEHDEFYAGLALFNNSQDSDLNSDWPTLPYVAEHEARQKWLQASRSLTASQQRADELGRAATQAAMWLALPLQKLESTSGEIAEVDGEVRVVSGTVAVGSTYTLTTQFDTPTTLTALRLHILPVSDDPKNWPEQGSVLSHIKATVVDAKHQTAQDREPESSVGIEFDVVIPDVREGSYACEDVLEKNANGFGGYPKLFAPRWMVITLADALVLNPNQTLRIELRQDASVTGGLSTHLRRFHVEFTDDAGLITVSDDPELIAARAAARQLAEELKSNSRPSLPILQDRDVAATRATRQFIRGNWLDRGEVIEPAIPQVFQSEEAPIPVHNRLELARWLVSDQNPLAARVWVNRIWSELFGLGIVETLEDFGVSGLPPSHPELLDHLAQRMRGEYQWSLKRLLKELVLSATYRQDSRVTPDAYQLDPRNRNLSRGPRTRLTAEMIRDSALLASGALCDKVGGPSVMPPQPDGVWQQVYSGDKWEVADGDDRFRRGVYTYWKRTSPYPGFVMFDTPNRDVCSPRRIATNTPLQALVTLNSEVYTELSQKLAKRCLQETNDDVRGAIEQMFLRVASRQPQPEDVEDLLALHARLSSAQQNDPLAAVGLAILNSDWALTK